jgi:hypothetical protein
VAASGLNGQATDPHQFVDAVPGAAVAAPKSDRRWQASGCRLRSEFLNGGEVVSSTAGDQVDNQVDNGDTQQARTQNPRRPARWSWSRMIGLDPGRVVCEAMTKPSV